MKDLNENYCIVIFFLPSVVGSHARCIHKENLLFTSLPTIKNPTKLLYWSHSPWAQPSLAARSQVCWSPVQVSGFLYHMTRVKTPFSFNERSFCYTSLYQTNIESWDVWSWTSFLKFCCLYGSNYARSKHVHPNLVCVMWAHLAE